MMKKRENNKIKKSLICNQRNIRGLFDKIFQKEEII